MTAPAVATPIRGRLLKPMCVLGETEVTFTPFGRLAREYRKSEGSTPQPNFVSAAEGAAVVPNDLTRIPARLVSISNTLDCGRTVNSYEHARAEAMRTPTIYRHTLAT